MKHLTKKKQRYWSKLSRIRFFKKLRRRYKKSQSKKAHSIKASNNEFSAIAPAKIDLYKSKLHTEFIEFKHDLEAKADAASQSNYSKSLRICFRNTTHITAAAGLLLVATVDNIIAKHPGLSFKVTRPPNQRTDPGTQTENLVDSVLAHLGFYKLIGHGDIKRRCDAKTVTCWQYAYGDDASGEIAATLIQKLASYGVQTNKLYRSCFEAVANATEHAYTDKITPSAPFNLKRWWFFVGVLNDKITVLICDQGHGIPNTLEVTQSESMLTRLWKKLNFSSRPTNDCELIRASTIVKETRTKEDYRGKGGTDIKTFVDQTEDSSMLIFSNHGFYKYSGANKPAIALDNKMSVGGTIIQWTIPYLDSEEK
ncbi:hypothetical protein L3Q72_19915 [Vibrio sp. JC009]|uniref:hypothetical protein n=1 Tax=Vibrio sp. JC009 TaxID=2912314 RepID=UPI0023B1F9C0|nr:hypothetical protein [Vibrio sp. JC009]WED23509.1 hypothetical protein L3Q72_19915 [Vibrio sp. JC009]